ncbi:MAG: ATP-dependent zinc metalloprotease FtsH, partial [Romboutsia sp.]|nr:ATP-dependent zinc metalloprotease FtsH [Romboutsia sp.]
MIYYYIVTLLIVMLLNVFLFPSMKSSRTQEVNYNTFISMLNKNEVKNVKVEDNEIVFTPSNPNSKKIYITGKMNDPDLVTRLEKAEVSYSNYIPQEVSPIANFLLTWIGPIFIFILLGQILSRTLSKRMGGPGAMQFGKSNAKVYVEAQTGKTFNDVAGQDEAKEALTEIVDFLNNPDKYKEIGAKMPKGALLVGPPGTGKTLLAKAVAGEANVPFFSISGSEFVEMFVGMGAARVRDLFKQAQEKAPCIVFIDEIDTIGKKRDSGNGMGGNDEREQTLNQLLTEMDGFDGGLGVVILAATNRPESLAKALLRPGRFDRRIPVEMPDLAGREAIIKVHAKNVKTEPNIDYNVIARATSGASGAELANIVNEAAIATVKDNRTLVSQRDLEEAVEVVIAGYQRKGAVISDKEKRIIAYHEIGHALVAAIQSNSDPVHKITIIPRTSGALGYTMQVSESESVLMSKDEAFNKITTFTGGRAAEEIIFNICTSGASNDIEQATKIARAMITRFGMSDEFGMVALETVNNPYLGSDASLTCSSETAAKVDQEVLKIIKSAHTKATNILKDNIDKLHELSEYLLEKETITGSEFMKILNNESLDEIAYCKEDSNENTSNNK